MKKYKGLVLSGGGAKGRRMVGTVAELSLIHSFDVIATISVGTLIGIMLAIGRIDVAIDVFLKVRNRDILKWKLPFTPGVFSNKGLYKLLKKYVLGRRTNCDLHIGCVRVETGDVYYHLIRKGELIEEEDLDFIVASCTIPVVFPPVETAHEVNYIDGGVRDSIPTRAFFKNVLPRYRYSDVEFERLHIVNCNPQSYQYEKKWTNVKMFSRFLEITQQEIIENDLEMINYYNGNPDDDHVHIPTYFTEPKEQDIGMLEFTVKHKTPLQVIEDGRKDYHENTIQL